MYLKHLFSDKKIFILVSSLIFVSVLIGSVCCSNSCSRNDLYNYFSEFLKSTQNASKLRISLDNLEELMFVFFAVFFSAFLKLGILINTFVVCRRSFVMGYTVTAFFKAYGMKGIFLLGGALPEMIMLTTVLIVFSGCAIRMSLTVCEKKYKIYFIFFALLFGTIFCGLGFFDGYFTTTFMGALGRWIA